MAESKAKRDTSWDFIYKITDQVKQFSEKDIQAVFEAGRTLHQNGAAYQHVKGPAAQTPEKAKTASADVAKSSEKAAEKKQEQGAGR